MALIVGAQLGPYRIETQISAGGMGEVYKARDTRLDRTVAIKVLPSQFASDPQFRERFDREARAISQLTHPHICTLYDVGHHDGTDFLVMEFLDGETLADRLRSKYRPLPLNEAVTIAIQIADALDQAHRAGIVHRDLKPGNVMLTKVGAKLLDFGLAKTATPVVAGAGLSVLPTTPPHLTAQGTILGTFQYMAPEQLEGREADARTDIFAFGAVLYEMLTGRKAFEGKSQASLIAAILDRDPPAVSTVQPLTPPELDRVVKTCLEKDPDERWQTARDLLRVLKWVAETGSQTAASTGAAPLAGRVGRMALMSVAVAVVVTAAVAGAFATFYVRGAPATDAPLVRFGVSPPQNATLIAGAGSTPAVSPDGRHLAFAAARAGSRLLWVRSLEGLDAEPLTGTEGGSYPFWSPDSRTLGFFSGITLKTVDVSGGPVRILSEISSGGVRGATWGLDSTIVVGSFGRGLYKVSANGGSPTPVTHLDAARGETAHRFPAFLPDGRHFLYWASPSNTVWLGSIDGGEPTRLLTADSQAAYVAGRLLFVRRGTLVSQSFDAGRATLTGEAVPIAEQVLTDPSGGSVFSASPNGTLAYRTGTPGVPTQLTWVDRVGRPIATVGQRGRYRSPALSPDGTRVALEVLDVQSRTVDIWLAELTRSVTSRFTFNPGNDFWPVWSPDGSWIIFGSERGRAMSNLYRKRADGSGSEELVLKSPTYMAPYTWAPDGLTVVYRTIVNESGTGNLGILPLAGERIPRLFDPSRFVQAYAQVSPDGRWIAFTSNETGRNEVYVQSFPAPGGGKWQISKDGGSRPRWRRDGQELFYYASNGRLVAVPIKTAAALQVGVAVPLFEAHMFGGPDAGAGTRQQYDVSRDGQRFLINVPLEEESASSISVVLNWTAGLKDR